MGSARSRTTPESVAYNSAVFRDANENIREKANDWEMDGLLPTLCECADPSCSVVLRLTPRQYEDVRANPRWFINSHGHQGEDESHRIVAEHDRYVIVETIGKTGEMAEQLDSRTESSSA